MPDAWPSFRGQNQKPWEPPRQIESQMARVINGYSSRLDYGDLCESVCDHVAEVRMLGNGVVPATVTKAFISLFKELSQNKQTPMHC